MCRCGWASECVGWVGAWCGRDFLLSVFFGGCVGAWVPGPKMRLRALFAVPGGKKCPLGPKTNKNMYLGPRGPAGPARNLSPILAYSLTWQIWQGRLGRPRGLLVSFYRCGREFLLSVSFGGCVGAWVRWGAENRPPGAFSRPWRGKMLFGAENT